MARRLAPAPVSTNHLLAALPVDDYERIALAIEVLPLKLKRILHKPGDSLDFIYFPGDGFCSVLTVMEDGGMVEVATIGREGMVGLSAILDGSPSPSLAMVQAEIASCSRLPVEAFRREMARGGPFRDLMHRYANAMVGVIMQGTGCNAAHSVEQRLARWLLLAHDRMESDVFPLTQEFVAMMLGVARPTVTVVAGTLQKAGLITYRRGHVAVRDRRRLEAAACECYRASIALMRAVTAPLG